MSELDDAGTYFDLGPRKVTSNGIFHYMCTRNNNFSNRGQKGKFVVGDTEIAVKKIGWNGGNVTVDLRYLKRLCTIILLFASRVDSLASLYIIIK